MGFFDFLKRKQKVFSDDGPSVHYVFAHYALRQFALSDPLQYLAILGSPDAGRFLDTILDEVRFKFNKELPFDAADLEIHTTRIGNFPCAVLEMPEPQQVTEAYMTALVAKFDPTQKPLPSLDEIEARYFTLELGYSESWETRTVLAEWTESTHANYGDGPNPTVDEFLAAIAKQL